MTLGILNTSAFKLLYRKAEAAGLFRLAFERRHSAGG